MKILGLLKNVARSFYLTIWWLPSTLREPIALAYLLARASDTIADETSQSMTPSERELVKLLPALKASLNDSERNQFDAHAIKLVWQTILEGQRWDLENFSQYPSQERQSCRTICSYQSVETAITPEELDRYLYLVAGCVGEFWTIMAAHHVPYFAKESLENMIAMGVDYGKGLQLINVLRDRYRDRREGRYYFKEDQVSTLHLQTLRYLKQGEAYVTALHPGRLKVATALPLLLGKQTLNLLKKHPNSENLKIVRWRVYITLIGSLKFLFF